MSTLSNIYISSNIHSENLWPVEVNHMVGVIFYPHLSIPGNVEAEVSCLCDCEVHIFI